MINRPGRLELSAQRTTERRYGHTEWNDETEASECSSREFLLREEQSLITGTITAAAFVQCAREVFRKLSRYVEA